MTSRDTWSAKDYNNEVPFVYSPSNTSTILELLNARPGERVCDFGCGSGEITLELQKLVGGGTVVGVDSSESMIQQAQANGLKQVIVADIQDPTQVTPGGGKFDAVFSNAALHWCKRDPGGVLESAKRVLRPGGRFVIEMGGFANCIGIRSTLHAVLRKHGVDPVGRDPWYFPSPEDYQNLLEKHGFRVSYISLKPRLTSLKGNIRDWVHVFCRNNFLRDLGEGEVNGIMDEVNELCAVDCRDSQGQWSAMYTRLRVVAIYT